MDTVTYKGHSISAGHAGYEKDADGNPSSRYRVLIDGEEAFSFVPLGPGVFYFIETAQEMIDNMEYVSSVGISIDTPGDFRKGQTISNFLGWIKKTQPTLNIVSHSDEHGARLADPFYISDSDLDMLFAQFVNMVQESINRA
jgi:hypothetical protein